MSIHVERAPVRPATLPGTTPPAADASADRPAAPAAASAAAEPEPVARSARWSWHLLPAALVGADVLMFTAAMVLTDTTGLKTLSVLVLVLVLFHAGDLYRARLSLSVLDDTPAVMGRALAAGAGAMVLGGLDDGLAGTARLRTALVFGGLCLVGRAAVYQAIRYARRHARLRERTLLLGAGTLAGSLAGNLLTHPEYGLQPVGLLDDDPLLVPAERPVPLLGGYGDLCGVVTEQRIDVVVVTFGSVREPSMVSLLRSCDRLSCEIYFVPRLYELHALNRDTEVLWGLPLVRLRRAPFRTGAWTGKRVGDAVIAGLALLVLLPVMLPCALLSRWETGSVLFRQTRVGLDGRPFTLLKFCSLRPAGDVESGTRWNIAADQRLGPVGKFLRRTSFDELPQLWNVLRGDMSLVGPRPERPYFVDEFTRQYPWYTARHRVPVGLTGWAQVNGLRGDTSIADRARFDNIYIQNWSMWGDMKILVRTVGEVLRAAGR